jgi:hypothetical protein
MSLDITVQTSKKMAKYEILEKDILKEVWWINNV